MLFKHLLITALTTGVLTLFAGASTAEKHEQHIFLFDDVAWQPAGVEGVEMAILWGEEEDSTAIYAFRVQPGVEIPAHLHTNDYWGIAVQGTWEHIDANGHVEATGQEGYALIRGGDVHGDRCAGPEVCINVLDFVGARDFIMPE